MIAKKTAAKIIKKYTGKVPPDAELERMKERVADLCQLHDGYRLGATISLFHDIGEKNFMASKIPRYIRTGQESVAATAFLHYCLEKGQKSPARERRRREEIDFFTKESGTETFFDASQKPNLKKK